MCVIKSNSNILAQIFVIVCEQASYRKVDSSRWRVRRVKWNAQVNTPIFWTSMWRTGAHTRRTHSFFARFIYFGCFSRAPAIFSNWILCVALIRVPRQLFPRYAAESWWKARHWMLCMWNANWMNPQQRWMEKKWRFFLRASLNHFRNEATFSQPIPILHYAAVSNEFKTRFFFCKCIQCWLFALSLVT